MSGMIEEGGIPVYCVDCDRYAGHMLKTNQRVVDGVIFSFCPMLCGSTNVSQFTESEDDDLQLQNGTRRSM